MYCRQKRSGNGPWNPNLRYVYFWERRLARAFTVLLQCFPYPCTPYLSSSISSGSSGLRIFKSSDGRRDQRKSYYIYIITNTWITRSRKRVAKGKRKSRFPWVRFCDISDDAKLLHSNRHPIFWVSPRMTIQNVQIVKNCPKLTTPVGPESSDVAPSGATSGPFGSDLAPALECSAACLIHWNEPVDQFDCKKFVWQRWHTSG